MIPMTNEYINIQIQNLYHDSIETDLVIDEKLMNEINQLNKLELIAINKSLTQLLYTQSVLLGKSKGIMGMILNCVTDTYMYDKCNYMVNGFIDEITTNTQKGDL
jgi:hypothetical protein